MKTTKLLSMLFVFSALCFGLASCGKEDDDIKPIGENPENDYSQIISGNWGYEEALSGDSWVYMSISFNNKGAGSISFQDLVDQAWGVMANGTYTLSGSKITATYTDVTVFDSNFNYSSYHGFTHGKNKTVKYTIISCNGKKLALKDESGKTITYEKY